MSHEPLTTVPQGELSLNEAALPDLLDRGLPGPTYDRSALRPRIVHIGVGGFHRAHLAVYCHRLAAAGSDWGIRGIGLRPENAAIAEALAAQDHLYTFTKRGSDEQASEVIGSIIDFVLADVDDEPAVAAIAAPDTAIVSLTVTEAGYSDDEGNQRTFDVIAASLDRRRSAGLGPLTILSCDNLPGNGDAAHGCVAAAAGRVSAELQQWVEATCSFPNSMVDRITPVTAESDRVYLHDRYGLDDRWPVVAELFTQWVLEDHFVAGRPDVETVDALFTDDVRAWELYKLRLLNAGHSTIAYLSALAGVTFVDEALADPVLREFLTRLLLDEAVPTLTPIEGHPREDYVATVLERFANTGVRDQIARLCIDGTAKFPTFLMPTIESQLAVDGPIERSALALAGWAHYLATVPEADQAADALGAVSRARARAALDEPAAFLSANPAFPAGVSGSARFAEVFTSAHHRIAERGPLGAIASL